MGQQLVARIRKNSRYSAQAPRQTWFAVTVTSDRISRLLGNNNNYSLDDVVLGVVVGDKIIELAGGKEVVSEIYGLRETA